MTLNVSYPPDFENTFPKIGRRLSKERQKQRVLLRGVVSCLREKNTTTNGKTILGWMRNLKLDHINLKRGSSAIIKFIGQILPDFTLTCSTEHELVQTLSSNPIQCQSTDTIPQKKTDRCN